MRDRTNEGVIVKIGGPVLDVQFQGEAPKVRDLLISADGKHMEVAANASPGVVRCIALEATDGMRCGTAVRNTGRCISVPVGEAVLGRVVDVLGLSLIHISEPTRRS